jgi:hypothetical protein
MKFLKADWITFEGDIQGQYTTAVTACLFIAGFFAALRGEELVRVDLGAMRKYWTEAVNYVSAMHVSLSCWLEGSNVKLGRSYFVSLWRQIPSQKYQS